MSRYDITQAYMMTWDIPYYLRCFGRGLSLAQNVDAMFFEDRAPLKDEFDSLFSSLFSNPGVMATIAKALNTKDRGLTRTELPEATGIAYSGEFSRHLRAFVTGAFVTKYISFGNGRREAFYELTDTSACSGCASCGSRRPGRPTGSTSRTRGRWSHGGGMPSRTSA